MLRVGLSTIEWDISKDIIDNALRKKSKKSIVNLMTLIITTYMCLEIDMGLGVIAGVVINNLLK